MPCKGTALPAELRPLFLRVGLTRLEQVTSRLSGECSNQLSYRPVPGAGRPAALPAQCLASSPQNAPASCPTEAPQACKTRQRLAQLKHLKPAKRASVLPS
jgi:hypothetical protein